MKIWNGPLFFSMAVWIDIINGMKLIMTQLRHVAQPLQLKLVYVTGLSSYSQNFGLIKGLKK